MTSPLLDELELWIKRARAIPDEELRDFIPPEGSEYQMRLGPFLIQHDGYRQAYIFHPQAIDPDWKMKCAQTGLIIHKRVAVEGTE